MPIRAAALVACVILTVAPSAQQVRAQSLPLVWVLSTGGTISGRGASSASLTEYTVGAFRGEDLVKAVPEIAQHANVKVEQIFNVASPDLTLDNWIALATRVNAIFAGDQKVAGIVITHGTNTLEETAYFLNLTVKSDKPVVLVGSMRPATAVSADGPGNLYNAVAAAADRGARGRGVLVVLNDEIHNARNVIKTDTTNVETFRSPNRGPSGLVHTGKIAWFERMDKRHTTKSEFDVSDRERLPRVDVIYAHANMSPDLITAALKGGAQGLVIAGVGDGNMTKPALDTLAAAAKQGIVVVRSTRLPSGMVLRDNEVPDQKLGFVASGELNPAKSRVLLQLALTRTKDPARIQRMFEEY
jgi:L-asparaginase